MSSFRLLSAVIAAVMCSCSNNDGNSQPPNVQDAGDQDDSDSQIDSPNDSKDDEDNTDKKPPSPQLPFSFGDVDCDGFVAESVSTDPPKQYPFGFWPATCQSCSANRCSNAWADVVSLSAIDDFIDCLIVCNDETCSEECGKSYANEGAALDALLVCTACSCKNECAQPHKYSCFSSHATDACRECVPEKCLDLCDTFAEIPNKGDFWDCSWRCGETPTCIHECSTDRPEVGDAYLEYKECIIDNCEAECHEPFHCRLGNGVMGCDLCLDTHCTSECSDAMGANPFQYDICMYQCWNTFDPEQCEEDCDAAFPNTGALIEQFRECHKTNCDFECSLYPP
ncbi:MAG: hypothetical protein FWD57_15915 [Polyangiaceae bacterium]|nr:hypothetical protein [Polyangiaceae bacterium]